MADVLFPTIPTGPIGNTEEEASAAYAQIHERHERQQTLDHVMLLVFLCVLFGSLYVAHKFGERIKAYLRRTTFNPISSWKSEHKLALLCAAVLGAGSGTFIGFRTVTENRFGIEQPYWFAVSEWTVAGTAIGATLIFIRQLLRA